LKSGFFGDSIVNDRHWYSVRNGRLGRVAEETYTVGGFHRVEPP